MAEVNAGGGVTVDSGAPKQERKATAGVGSGGVDKATQLTILTSREMRWNFDKSTGKWYVQYGLPNSDRSVIFEASPDQMDALFGKGMRPTDYRRVGLSGLTRNKKITFAGNISEVEGKGSFEAEVKRVTALALDSGRLPSWAKGDKEVLDLIYVAQSENKSDNWLLEQMTNTESFKKRFPGISKMKQTGNMTWGQAVSGFLEYEAGVKAAAKSYGMSVGAVTPELVGKLINRGHSLDTINEVSAGFKRMKQFAPALDAFNQVLAARGIDPITTSQDLFNFVSGRSSPTVYNMYEAASIQEAATKAGLGDIFSANDAIKTALATEQTLETASNAFKQAAQLLLRMRHQVDVGAFGLNQEDLIDISLGQVPRSGKSEVEVGEIVSRAVESAQKELQKRSTSAKTFSQSGTPQAASLRGLRVAE